MGVGELRLRGGSARKAGGERRVVVRRGVQRGRVWRRRMCSLELGGTPLSFLLAESMRGSRVCSFKISCWVIEKVEVQMQSNHL